MATEAVRTLVALGNRPASESVRLGVARAVLEFGMKECEKAEVEERLVAVEKWLAADDV
ncbi:MAG TPA: hypothetical protein VH643_25865 [Gemmataceae bacterium]